MRCQEPLHTFLMLPQNQEDTTRPCQLSPIQSQCVKEENKRMEETTRRVATTWQRKVCVRADGSENRGKGPGRVELIPEQSGSQPEAPDQPRGSLKVLLLDSGPQSSAESQAHGQPRNYLLN